MATWSQQINSVAGRDGHEHIGNSTWYAGNYAGFNKFGRANGQNRYNPGWRFLTVSVPQGASITSAFLTLNVTQASGTFAAGRFYGDDADDSAAWSSADRPSQRTATTASTAVPSWSVGITQVGVTAIIQEIVDRTGWASKNDINLFGLITGAPAANNLVYIDANATYGTPTPATLKIVYSAGGADPVLTAEAGSVTVTGTDAGLLVGRAVAAESGTVTVTGTDATLSVASDTVLTAEAGSVTVAGTDAALLVGRALEAEAGAFTITGTDPTLILTRIADAGAFTITGMDADLRVGFTLAAEAGALTVTGTDAAFVRGLLVAAEAGAVTVTGTDATLSAASDSILAADAGSLGVSGQDAGLRHGRLLTAGSGSHTVTGASVGVAAARLISAAAGAVVVTGTDATLTYGGAPRPLTVRLQDQRTATPRYTTAIAAARATTAAAAPRNTATTATT